MQGFGYPLKSVVSDLLAIKRLQFFLLLCLISFLLLFIKKNFIEFEITAFQILDERGQLGLFKAISALQYFTIPIIYNTKFTFIAFIVWVGCFTFGYRVTYANCWHIVMVSEIVFVLPELIKIIWFLVVETDPDFARVKAFYPLSLMNFFNHETLGAKWHYPLKSLSIFELIYTLFIIAGIYLKSGKQYSQSVIIGVFGYVLPFLFWLVYYTLVYK
jgi:hypothetical protein